MTSYSRTRFKCLWAISIAAEYINFKNNKRTKKKRKKSQQREQQKKIIILMFDGGEDSIQIRVSIKLILAPFVGGPHSPPLGIYQTRN